MVFPINERFNLSDNFIDQFKNKQPVWGPLGYISYKRTYARWLPTEKRTEEFWETLQRVVEGCYTIQLNHCRKYRLPWNAIKAQYSAQNMFRLMWEFKFLPPGRGLWMMGTDYIWQRGAAPLMNCAFVSTKDLKEETSDPFTFLMDMSMLGVGVAFDTKGAGQLQLVTPTVNDNWVYLPEDSKEGWVDTCRIILNAYFGKGQLPKSIDYSNIRPEGSPIKTFGGIAPGPRPLIQAEKDLMCLLKEEAKHNPSITSSCIVDIMNILGKCVVSGGIRRCLPEGTTVHTQRGLVPIEQITKEDKVVTSDGLKKVLEVVDQGEQETISIETQIGFVRCTPKHRWKVYTGYNTFEFKQAKDLVPGDKLVFYSNTERVGEIIDLIQPGGWDVKDTTRGQLLYRLPELSEALAWLIGFFQGDGCSYKSQVSFTTHVSELNVLNKAMCALSLFGSYIKPKIYTRADVNALCIRLTCPPLASFFKQFKSPRKLLHVPESILRAPNEIKAAYVSGLFDADGTSKNHPIKAVSTKYIEFADEVREVWAAIGVACRTNMRPDKRSNYFVSISGKQPLALAHQYLSLYSEKYNGVGEFRNSHNDYSFPVSWVREAAETVEQKQKIRDSKRKTVTAYTADQLFQTVSKTLPIEVISVDLKDIKTQKTWDLSIEDNHEFVIGQGLISHNTAELALGSPKDAEYVSLKDPNKYGDKLKEWRWASNNSVSVEVGEDYTALAQQTAQNGEPGYVWLDNCRHFGRLQDGHGDFDLRAAGVNPCGEQTLESYELCVSGDTFLPHFGGGNEIKNLVGQEVYVWNGKKWSPATPRKTGEYKKLFAVYINDGSILKVTGDHKWLVKAEVPKEYHPKTAIEYLELKTTELQVGDELPLTTPSHRSYDVKKDLGFKQDPNFPPLAGVSKTFIGIGSMFARDVAEFYDMHPDTYSMTVQQARKFVEGYLAVVAPDFKIGYSGGITKAIGTSTCEPFYETPLRARALQRFLRRIGLFLQLYDASPELKLCVLSLAPQPQYVQLITEIPGTHDTYCLTEPEQHACLFETVLTKQCNLVETFPSRHETFEEYQKTLKYAYLYAKTTTLIPTQNERTNQIIWRNRRIGLSQSGIIESFQKHGRREHFRWCDDGYKTVQEYDRTYSEWLGVPRSIKMTTVKPSGTISLLPGVTPGIHYPHSQFYYRTIRIDKTSPLLPHIQRAGYRYEESVYGDNTFVVYFPVREPNFDRSKTQVSVWEQLENAAQMQYYWADNQVSITVTFDPETEGDDLARALELYETRLKVVSFLPSRDSTYEQAPYQTITEEEYNEAVKKIKKLNFKSVDTHEEDEKFCTGEACSVQRL